MRGRPGDLPNVRTTDYTRSREASVEAVLAVLAASGNPEKPERGGRVPAVRRARRQRVTDRALGPLLLWLGAVALPVGGVEVANTMVISVLNAGWRSACEARSGPLEATSGSVPREGTPSFPRWEGWAALLGIAVTGSCSTAQNWPTVVPAWGQRRRSGSGLRRE
jgi:putative ABC transport system permease protein